MVPHQHHSESEDGKHHELIEDANSPLDFLILVFHEDLGEDNHMMEYNFSTTIQLSTPLLCVIPTIFNLEFNLQENATTYPPVYSEYTLTTELHTASRKRGPPAFI